MYTHPQYTLTYVHICTNIQMHIHTKHTHTQTYIYIYNIHKSSELVICNRLV